MAATRTGTSQAQRAIDIGASAERVRVLRANLRLPVQRRSVRWPPPDVTCPTQMRNGPGAALGWRSGAAGGLTALRQGCGGGQLPPVVDRDRVRPDSPRSDEPASVPELPCMLPDICSLPEEPCFELSPERWLALRLIRSW